MIKPFLKERLSWIGFFIFTQFFVLLVGYLDASIPFKSMLYIVFLTSLFFIMFIIVRYHQETRFYRELKHHSHSFDLTTVPEAKYAFERISTDMIHQQNDTYKRQLDELHTRVERDMDDTLSWIHEVKTPLTTMQLIIDRVEDTELRAQLMYEWLRIHLLLDQQLHQRRMPFIRNDLYIEKTNLESLLFQEIKALKLWCMQKGIGFDVNLQETEVLTDAKWFAFMVRQILTNAVKYSEASDIVIEGCSENERCVLIIEDHGRGIDAKDLPRIFDQGFTNTSAHHDKAATGMGLYLTKQVADSLHIDIQVASTLGKGTTFKLTFPKENDFVHITSM
ncbi:sensor histidine kinase [Lentibacillus saliphilus]|uniref:sensor histidine kinase n=1 Tax=Lentibacillus saliphilus TaxID=2737028 RepID=UPI001C30D99B|nr:sensor histidine kinase [Lentibacillus saliphilus]